MVPISFCTASSPDKPVQKILLDKLAAEVTLENVKPGDWVKVNFESTVLVIIWFLGTKNVKDLYEILVEYAARMGKKAFIM